MAKMVKLGMKLQNGMSYTESLEFSLVLALLIAEEVQVVEI